MTTSNTVLADVPARRPGFFKNLLYWAMDWDDEALLEERLRRMNPGSSFLDSLSPEDLEFIRTYDGPEVLGPALTRRDPSPAAAQA